MKTTQKPKTFLKPLFLLRWLSEQNFHSPVVERWLVSVVEPSRNTVVERSRNTLFIFLFSLFTFTSFAQGVAINIDTSSPDPSAMFHVASTEKGVLIPTLTTAQRDAIAMPASSLLIYNTTTKCFEFFETGAWHALGCACVAPAQPTAGIHVPCKYDIEWNWTTVSGAIGYKYNTVNDYGTATDNGTSTTYYQYTLQCETPYTLYVWAYNDCGPSSVIMLNSSTIACPFDCGVSNVTFTYKGSSVTYGTVVKNYGGGNIKCWLDRNLGASQVATSSTDANAYGDLFQWGRLDDGHQTRTSGTDLILSVNDVPGHDNFILTSSSPNDWRSPQNNNLWQGVSSTNNPCPSGWRVPTEGEWSTERYSWGTNNAAGAFGSSLKLPMAGYRHNTDGSLNSVGDMGYYWSSQPSNNTSRYLEFFNTDANTLGMNRAFGMSVRCIKD